MHGLESRLSEDHISTQLQQYKYEHVFTSITRVFQLAYGLSAVGSCKLDLVMQQTWIHRCCFHRLFCFALNSLLVQLCTQI